MWELDHNEDWVLKNWYFWTAVREKTLESPLDSKDIIPVNPKGNQPWIVIRRIDAEAEAEAPILWSPDVKNWLTGKHPDAGKDWRQEEKGMKEESEKAGLKFNIKKTKTMASGPISSVQFSCSVMSDSLWPHEPQHARLPCPSPIPRVYSNSCPSSQWCHPAISSHVVPFSSCLQPFPGSFPRSQFFTSGGQSIGVSASAAVLPMNIKDWFPLGSAGLISLQSKGLSSFSSNTTFQKHQFFSVQFSLWSNSLFHSWLLEKP